MPGDTERLRTLTRVLDEAIRIPGTRFRIGLDGLIGLLPGAGDALTTALSAYALLAASRMGAPPSILTRMAGNILLDAALGALPILGDVFDIAFKANRRNLRLLEQFASQPTRTRCTSRALIALTVIALLLLILTAAAGTIWIARTLLRLAA